MAEKFICSISIGHKDRSKGLILAGTEFEKDDIEQASFESLQNGGYLRSPDEIVIVVPKGRPLVSRPEVGIPVEEDKGPRNLVKGLNTPNKANTKAAKVAQDKAIKKAKADSVFNGNPEELAQMDFPVLMGAYQDICEKYGLAAEKYTTKEEVIGVLSSQFVKSK